MRYELNQTVWGIFFHLINSRTYPLFDKYMPEFHKGDLPEIEFRELTVKEHHKVPNEWDESNPPKLDCDGFILHDKAGTVYHNQYPRASYGMSDSGDARFTVSDDLWKAELKEKLDEFDKKKGERWNGAILEFMSLTRYLDELGTFLFNDWPAMDKSNLREGAEENVAKLQRMYDTVIEQFQKDTGNTIIVRDFTYGGKLIRVKGRHYINSVPEGKE